MTSYNDIYAAIKVRLEAVNIAAPVEITAMSVYDDPVGSIGDGDTPCFVQFSPAIADVERGPGGRKVLLDFMAQCFIQDADPDQAHAIAKALHEATVDSFDAGVVLGAVTPLVGQSLGRVEGLEYGGRQYIGFEVHLILRSVSAVNFAIQA